MCRCNARPCCLLLCAKRRHGYQNRHHQSTFRSRRFQALQVILTGTQLAFGSQDSDLKLAFERLERALAAKNARFDQVVLSHLYVTSSTLATRVLALQSSHPGARVSTVLPVEALPSLDAQFGLDVIAVPASTQP